MRVVGPKASDGRVQVLGTCHDFHPPPRAGDSVEVMAPIEDDTVDPVWGPMVFRRLRWKPD